MATTFTGLRVQDTYNAILKIGDNTNLSGTAKILSDGVGNSSSIYLSTTRFGLGITPAYQFHTSGNAKIGGNLIISGNLTVNGTLTYLNVTDLAVEDPLIKLAKDNTANTLDIGLFGKYVATGTKYKGFYNDASDDKFKLFIGTTVEPTTTVDTSASGYTVGTLVANLEGNADSATGVLITADNADTSRRMVFTESSNATDTDGKLFKDSASNFFYNPSTNRLTLVNLTATSATFSGSVSGIAPTSDLNFATKKYVDDQTIPTPTLSSVLSAGNSSGANDLKIIDDQKLLLGDDGDMQIYHNQVNSVFFNDTGNIVFRNNANDSDISFQTDDGLGYTTEYLRLDGDDVNVVFSKPISGTTATFTGLVTGIAPTADLNFATKKYVDDQTTPTPTLSSVLGAGNTSGANNIIMADSQKVFLGSDSDLEIYHDGTDGYIDNTNGELIIQNNSDDKKIIFKSDNGIGDITEYFRIDGNINRNVITVTTQLNDNVPLIFGSGAGRPSIKYDSTATQLFISGESKFLDDLYVVGNINGDLIGNVTGTSTRTEGVDSNDTRSTNPDPEDIGAGVYFDFKTNTVNGLSDGGTYNGMMLWRSYGNSSDLTGGQPIRIAYTANGNLYRQMGTSATTWGTWAKFAIESNGAYLPLSGGIMSGNIGRSAYNTGFQVGGYDNIGASHTKTNPIHTIGSSYLPTATALSSMYGIGYTRGDASFCTGTSGWGMYVAADGNSRIFLDGQNGGIGTANASWRAPIFYDKDDTTYYVDPGTANHFKGVTNFYTDVNVARGFLQATTTNDEHFIVATSGGEDIAFKDGGVAGTTNMIIRGDGDVLVTRNIYANIFYDSGNSAYLIDPSGGQLRFQSTSWTGEFGGKIQYHGNHWYLQAGGTVHFRAATGTNTFEVAETGIGFISNYLTGTNSLRAPIFYDSNDVNYYGDFSSTTIGKYYGRRQYAEGFQVGGYNNLGDTSAKTNPIYTIGSAYMPTETSLSNMYGIGHAHPNFWGTGKGSGWGMYIANNGTIDATIGCEGSTSAWFAGIALAEASYRSPIFYDLNDTAYYLDPASTSRIRKTNLIASGNGWDDGLNLYSSNASDRWNLLVDGGSSHMFRLAYNNSEKFRVQTDGEVSCMGEVVIGGNIRLTNGGIGSDADSSSTSNSAVRVSMPQGASFSVDGGVTGAIKIRLPRKANNSMWAMLVRIYNYATDQTMEYTMGNYSYSNGGYNSSASFKGASNIAQRNVRFGNDGTYDCVWIGETNSSWSYPVVSVVDFQAGFRNGTMAQWTSNWQISLVTSFDTVQTNINPSSHVGQNGFASDSFRAPVFYDSANTAYYGDFDTLVDTLKIRSGKNYEVNAPTYDTSFYVAQSQHFYGHSSTQTMYIGQNNTINIRDIGIAPGSFRAPHFYDSDNTDYYGDFASTSIFKYIGRRAHAEGFLAGGYNNIGASHAKTSPIYCIGSSYFPSDTSLSNMYGIGYTRGDMSQMPGTGGWGMYVAANGSAKIFLDGENNGVGSANASWRAPYFYDKDDTNYYGDFSSTTIGKYFGRRAHAEGFQVGSYNNVGANSAKSNPIYTIGSNYIPNETNLGGMYGIGYAHPNLSAWGSGKTSDWGMYVAANGTIDATIGDGAVTAWFANQVHAAGDFRAPIFYDLDNTGYWLNPAGNTSINTKGAWRCASSTWDGEFSGKIQYHGNWWYMQTANGVFIRNSSGSNNITLNSNGTGTFAGDVIAFSDKKLKTNIKTLDGTKVLKMRGVSFNRIDNNNTGSGVIAQELQEIAPELVSDTKGTLGVAYGNLTGYLIEAIKNQQKQIDELKTEIQTMKNN